MNQFLGIILQLTWSKQIMEGMLANDFIGFHTSIYKNNFFTCTKISETRADRERSSVTTATGETKVSSVPLGIDYDLFSSMKEKEEVENKTQYLREKIPTEKIVISVDRLGYTKGIPQRLRAFEMFPRTILPLNFKRTLHFGWGNEENRTAHLFFSINLHCWKIDCSAINIYIFPFQPVDCPSKRVFLEKILKKEVGQ